MKTIESVRAMQAWSEAERLAGKRVAFVPTMGFLHEGHLSLVEEARRRADRVVASIFVNPMQFNSKEDFEKYPRNEERDAKMLADAGTDALYLPNAVEMYPDGYQTKIDVTETSQGLCGEFRPGHFVGVATVVAKLFHAVKPHVAVFGEKDWQQLQVIRRMVRDLDFDLEIVGGETVREKDGLAMSSRNARLSPEERTQARAIPDGMKRVRDAALAGERDAKRLQAIFAEAVAAIGRLEYAELRHPESLKPVDRFSGEALFAVAVWVGPVRLIDNVVIREGSADANAPRLAAAGGNR